MMTTPKEFLKEEALWRMRKLNLYAPVIRDFERSERLYYSERTPLGGILYWLDNDERYINAVREEEGNYDIYIYHCTHEYINGDECLTCLYVPNDEAEWFCDREDLDFKDQDGSYYVMVRVINLSNPNFSEFGFAGIKNVAGGLVRTH